MSQPPQPPFSGQPYPEQPYSGQPNPDVPTSVPPQPGFPPPPQYGAQPGYPTSGQPAYAPGPEYGQPQPGYAPGAEYGQPQPGYGMMGPPQPPQKKSKALPIILVSVAVLLVLCVGGAAVIFVAARDTAGDIVEAAQSAAATPEPTATPLDPTDPPDPAPTTTAPATTTRNIKIVEPKKLGGRPKLTDPQFAAAAEELQSGLADVPGATNTVGALYGTPAKRDIIIIAGVEAPVDDPAQELDSTFLGAGVGGLKVTGITKVSPGPLGGEAKCGKAAASGVNMVLCGWADEGSVGWIIWYFKSLSKAKAEFPRLRGQIEKSS